MRRLNDLQVQVRLIGTRLSQTLTNHNDRTNSSIEKYNLVINENQLVGINPRKV